MKMANKLANGKWFYDNGKLKTVGSYINGKSAGEWRAYHENEQLEKIGQYDENGKRTGEWKTYYNNGKLESIGKSSNGKQIGEWKYYDRKGKLINKKL